MQWTLSRALEHCGYCRAEIAPESPIALVTPKRLMRCVACAAALGFAVDDQALDAERFRVLETRPEPVPVVDVPPEVDAQVRDIAHRVALADVAKLEALRPAREFDAKSASAGDDVPPPRPGLSKGGGLPFRQRKPGTAPRRWSTYGQFRTR